MADTTPELIKAADGQLPRGQTAERKAYMKNYVATHPKRDRRGYKKEYDERNREKHKDWRDQNAEKLKMKSTSYYINNREKILARVKEYGEKNKKRILRYQAKYYQTNADKVKGNVSAYRLANPEKKKHLENKRRANKFKNGGSHTLDQRIEKFSMLGNVCFYCGDKKPLTIDHDIPLSRGGTDNIDNILPACRSCNSKKHNMTSEEYLGN